METLDRRIRFPALALALALGAGPAAVRATDCNGNGVEDDVDIVELTSEDCNANGVPDECDLGSAPYFLDLLHTAAPEGLQNEALRGTATMGRPAIVDFDGDGLVDVAAPVPWVARAYQSGGHFASRNENEKLIVWFRGGGDGTFEQAGFWETETHPNELVATDLDGDGDPDIVSSNGTTLRNDVEHQYSVSVLRNDGNGQFGPSRIISFAFRPRALSVGDLNLDDRPDVVFSDAGGMMRVVLNRGDGSFYDPVEYPLALEAWLSATSLADVDADGLLDVVVGLGDLADTPAHRLAVLHGSGDGTLGDPSFVALDDVPHGLLRIDLERDSRPDFVTTNRGSGVVSIFANNPPGTLTLASTVSVRRFSKLVFADLNGDSRPDFTALRSHPNDDTGVDVFLGVEDGRFEVAGRYDYPEADEIRSVTFADLDADGDEDILVVGESLSVLTTRDDGTLAGPTTLIGHSDASFPGAKDAISLDLDEDGDLDVLTSSGRSWTTLVSEPSEGATFGGCADFLRGDVNADGQVSLSDFVTIRRWIYSGLERPLCADAADVTDDEVVSISDSIDLLNMLVLRRDWPVVPPAPFADPGRDRTVDPEGRNLGCVEYEVVSPSASDDVISVGVLSAGPGQQVAIPIHVRASSAVDAVQLVLRYDPAELEFERQPLSFEGTELEGIEVDSAATFGPHPDAGLLVIVVFGHMVREDVFRVPAGEDRRILWLHARVSPDVAPGTTISLVPEEGQLPAGPFGLRTELSFEGDSRFVSTIPRLEGAILNIVGDQALFVRGDSNLDDAVDLSDAVHTLGWLFLGTGEISCKDAADTNDDGVIELTDAILTLDTLFRGSGSIAAPYPAQGSDPTPDRLFCYRP